MITTATATEQDWAGVVYKPINRIYGKYVKFGTLFILDTATESGHSLLAANGLPIEKNYAILTLKNK